MATANPILADLDRLGPVLCKLGHARVNLSWGRDALGEFYFIDGTTADGKFFTGMGDTPSEALSVAERNAARPLSAGVYLDA